MKTLLSVTVFFSAAFMTVPADATPQFARAYQVDCDTCHTLPPRLNRRGEDFVARGYRFDEPALMASHRTIPVAVWNTVDLEHRASSDLTKGFPSRVEIISAGVVGRTRASYFIELRALSQQIGSGGRLLNRSGRFEDLFLTVPLGQSGALTATVGQFRALNQVDVSRRLSLSEPQAFSAGVADARPAASSARLTSLRAFSPAGRQPGVRLLYHRASPDHPADGWYAGVTLPLTGELTLPFTDAASFEFEARPKGVFGETYYRRGLASIGGHVFAGDNRALALGVAGTDLGKQWSLLGAAGFDRFRGRTAGRVSLGVEYAAWMRVVLGARLDHRTGTNRDPALLVYANGHLPFGPRAFRQAIRVQFEQTIQTGNLRSTFALGHVF